MKEIKKVVFDETQAKKVFKKVSSLWLQKRDVFANLNLAQLKMPAIKNRQQKANFIFALILAERGPIFSENVIDWFTRLWQTKPELFDPQKVAKMTPGQIQRAFVRVGIINSLTNNFLFKNFFLYWKHNFQLLDKSFGGNVLNIFKGHQGNLSALAKEIGLGVSSDSFLGIQIKLFAYFTAILQEENLIKYFPCPIPTDFHRLRLLLATEIIDLSEFEKPYRDQPRVRQVNLWYTHNDQVSAWSERFLFKNDFSHLIVGPALWHFSRQRCKAALQGFSQKNSQTKEGQAICLTCPLAKFCKWVVPSGPFYNGTGSLLVRYKRK